MPFDADDLWAYLSMLQILSFMEYLSHTNNYAATLDHDMHPASLWDFALDDLHCRRIFQLPLNLSS